MKVKSQIYLSSLLMVLLIGILAITLFIFSSKISRELETETTMDNIVNGITDLILVADDYITYPYDRKIRQWNIRYEEVESLVSTLPDTYKFESLKNNIELLHTLFLKLQDGIKGDRQSLLVDRVVGRIRIVSNELITTVYRVIGDKNKQVEYLQNRSNTILFLISLILIAVSVISAFITIRSIVFPLKQLVADTENISQGDLKHFLEKRVDQDVITNEFDELKQAFYAMATRLDQTIGGLQLSEESLQKSESRYRVLFEESPIALLEEDFSRVKVHIDSMRSSGIVDFKSYFTSYPEAVAQCAQNIKIIDVNQKTLELFRAGSKEQLLDNLDKVFGTKSYEAFINELTFLAEGRYKFELQSSNYTLQGNEIQILLGLTVVPGYEDTWSKVLVSLFDMTKHVEVEAELSKYRGHLEEMVQKRTEELNVKTEKIEKSTKALTYLMEDVNEAREELQQVNSDYIAANNELKEFAYIVSHDLKAPLRAISQLTHWISEDYSEIFDADAREQMDLILQRVKRMDGLIDGVLRYSRVGRIKEKEEELDLNLLVENVISNLAVPETIKVLVENRLPTLFRDPTRMGQVFQNLIENGIKYMDKDEGIIKVDCVDEETKWTFSISDNGPGIDEKYHEKIFQIFKTLTSRDEHESTGIGLTLVKKIITLYGGSVWLESEIGHGSTFFFTLPKQDELVKR